jgi:hypothetical protein
VPKIVQDLFVCVWFNESQFFGFNIVFLALREKQKYICLVKDCLLDCDALKLQNRTVFLALIMLTWNTLTLCM